MYYTLNPDSPTPLYLQLYQHIREDILNGTYPHGSRLPSKRVIALDTGTSVITVEHALQLLSDEGYTHTRIRSGHYVSYRESDFQLHGSLPRPLRAASDGFSMSCEASVGLAQAGHNTASKRSGVSARPGCEADCGAVGASAHPGCETSCEKNTKAAGRAAASFIPAVPSDCFPFSVLSKTIRRVLSLYGERILVKADNAGCPELRRELCAYLARSRGIFVSEAQLLIGSGAEYLYGLIAQLLGDEGSFALEHPAYEKIRQVYSALGIHCELLPLGPNGISSPALQASSAAVLHVTPFHSFPSGITADISKKREYLSWARAKGSYIVEDNYDSELTVSRKAEDSVFAMSADDNVIYLNSFSKTLAPSLRIAYMILPQELLPRFQKRLGFYSCTVPVLDQLVLAELLKNGDFERNLNRMRRKRRQQPG